MKQNFTVRQGALDGVEAFLSVARHKSFRRAAAELGVTPSAISQAVRALEGRIGATLFIRTTRSVGLTEAGGKFFARAKPAFEELVAAAEVARGLGERPSGLLRLTVPRAVIPLLLQPLIASFCRAYPEIEVEIAASEELVDLAAEGFDAGIRLGQFIAADMVAVRLTPPFRFVIVGSPAYLARSGRPKEPRGSAPPRMPAPAPPQRRPSRCGRSRTATVPWRWPFRAHSSPMIFRHSWAQRSKARVSRKCPSRSPPKPWRPADWFACWIRFAPMTPGVFLYHPGRRQVMPKLRAFIDHVKGHSARMSPILPAHKTHRGKRQ